VNVAFIYLTLRRSGRIRKYLSVSAGTVCPSNRSK